MLPPRLRLAALSILLAACAAAPAALAHDPYEITSDLRVETKHLELRVTFARLTALKVAAPETGGRKQFGPNQFDEVKAALEQCARRAIRLSVAGQPLAPSEVEASLTIESDIEFRLVLPRPAAGPVRFEAAFLRDLEDPGYAAVVQVIHRRKVIKHELLRRDAPVAELALPVAD